MIPNQMKLSEKQKSFSQIFADFFEYIWNFQCFEKKGNPHIFCIFEITSSENVIR